MIDGSEKHSRKGGFGTSEFACFGKAQQRKGVRKGREQL